MPKLFGYQLSRTQEWLIPVAATILITAFAAFPAYIELFSDDAPDVEETSPEPALSAPALSEPAIDPVPIYQPPADGGTTVQPPSPQTQDLLPTIHNKTAPDDAEAPLISPPRDRAAETIVLPRMKLAPDMVHTLCAGRLPLEYRFSVFNPLAVKLALPVERDLEINEVLPFEGCQVTFLGVEQDAERRAVFRVEWEE